MAGYFLSCPPLAGQLNRQCVRLRASCHVNDLRSRSGWRPGGKVAVEIREAAHEPSYGSSQMRKSSTTRRFDCREPGFPPIPRPEPQPKPDTEPQPGSDPDVVSYLQSDPNLNLKSLSRHQNRSRCRCSSTSSQLDNTLPLLSASTIRNSGVLRDGCSTTGSATSATRLKLSVVRPHLCTSEALFEM